MIGLDSDQIGKLLGSDNDKENFTRNSSFKVSSKMYVELEKLTMQVHLQHTRRAHTGYPTGNRSDRRVSCLTSRPTIGLKYYYLDNARHGVLSDDRQNYERARQ